MCGPAVAGPFGALAKTGLASHEERFSLFLKKEDMDVTEAEIDLYFGWHEKVLHNRGG